MVLRWRGSQMAAPGGAVAVRTTARERLLPLLLSSSRFRWFSLFLLCPWFVFFFCYFSFVPSLPSLTFVLSFLSLSSLRSLFSSVFFFFFSFCSLFIGKKGAGPFASAPWERVSRAAGRPPSATARRRFLAFGKASGRSASGFGWWSRARGFGLVGARRESGRFKEENHFSLPVAGSGGKKKGEQCRSKRHRSVFFFFIFYFMNETALFWRKRAVSFKNGTRTS